MDLSTPCSASSGIFLRRVPTLSSPRCAGCSHRTGGSRPTEQWGDPAIIADRLGARFDATCFERGSMAVPALSVNHYRLLIESTVGPMQTLVDRLATDPQQLGAIRADYEALIGLHFAGNVVRHDYLLTRAQAC